MDNMENREKIHDLKNMISKHIDEQELISLTEEMIRIPSHDGVENQETKVAEYIKSVFGKEDIPCHLKEIEDGRCNVIAALKGTGGGKTLLLNGHTDTVGPDGMPGAFNPAISGGKLFGRGSSDMKGPLASMIGAVLAIKRSGLKLRGDLIFTGVINEECGSMGTISLLEDGLTADAAIVGEPTELQICTAHRGVQWYEFHFIGNAVHGGCQSSGVNAIEKAVDFINEVRSRLVPEIYARTHPLLKEATLNIGVIHGGTQLSTVAGDCYVYVDRRFLPDESHAEGESEFMEIIERLEKRDPDFKCEMKITDKLYKDGYYPVACETPTDHPFVTLMEEVVESVTESKPVLGYFPAWTDGGLLSTYGKIPTVILGPGIIKCCHSKEEYIPIAHLSKAALIYALTAINYCNQ